MSKLPYEFTYWNNKGLHQSYLTTPTEYIPAEGERPNNMPKLEKLRVAT